MTRISELPRRDWRARTAKLIEPLSRELRTNDTAMLRPVQAAALLECMQNFGVFVNGRVGIGKTYIAAMASVMLAEVMPAVRTLILVPGGIKKTTAHHFAQIRQEWKVPGDMLLMSYTNISRMPAAGECIGNLFGEGVGPTVIICDEADKLRHVTKSAVAKQVHDWMKEHPQTVFIVVTGTCDVEGLCDYAHLMDWCLRDRSPLPRTVPEMREWSSVIDAGESQSQGFVAQELGLPKDASIARIRATFYQRIRETPGVIIDDSPFTDVDLSISEHVIDPDCHEHFERLRDFHERPDGIEITPGIEVEGADVVQGSTIWPVARRMGRGLCYVEDPLPPQVWMDCRRAYFGWVRRKLEEGDYYTELQCRRWAMDACQEEWLKWQEIEPTFSPNPKALWLSTVALDWCEAWGRADGGVIWVDDIAFGVELARRTGWDYFQGHGMAKSGRHILEAEPGSTAIASRKANGTGLNLQYQWHRCLFTTPVNTSRDFEQTVGRFHREGQKKNVQVDILLACNEDFGSMSNMRESAKRTAATLYAQKAASTKWCAAMHPSAANAAFRP